MKDSQRRISQDRYSKPLNDDIMNCQRACLKCGLQLLDASQLEQMQVRTKCGSAGNTCGSVGTQCMVTGKNAGQLEYNAGQSFSLKREGYVYVLFRFNRCAVLVS